MNKTTKRLIPDGARNAPHSRPLPPNRAPWGDSGGEAMKWVETLTQGGARWDAGPELLPLAGPGLGFCRPYRALEGTSGILPLELSKNVQSPVLAFQAK